MFNDKVDEDRNRWKGIYEQSAMGHLYQYVQWIPESTFSNQ